MSEAPGGPVAEQATASDPVESPGAPDRAPADPTAPSDYDPPGGSRSGASAASSQDPPSSPIVLLEDDEPGEEVEEGSPAWMMTFGDMMSLLLTFFILLFSMSTIEVEKFKAAAESLSEAFGEANIGVLPDGAAPIGAPVETPDQAVEAVMDDLAEKLEDFVEENRLEEQVVVSKESHGVFLRMQDGALFRPGSANINEGSVAIVEQLGSMINELDLPVKVSGHTDNVPINSASFPSNWELSAARAAGVARTLVSRGRNPGSVAVEAYGEYQPLATNDTPEGRAKNRRVELYFSRISVEATLEERGAIGDGADGIAPEVEEPAASDPATGADEAGASGGVSPE